jgi:hypothetical protein
MALAGTGAICIWNDITPEGRDTFYAWHLHEHMPERAAIAGFCRGRRYVATDAATRPEYFTLYETATPAVLTSPAYLARLNAPTEWTRRATQAFRNTARALTRVEASLGPGAGGFVATIRFAVAAGRETEAIDMLASVLLPAIAGLPQITGSHLCRTDLDASDQRTNESRGRTDIGAAPGWVVLIEACNEPPLRQALDNLLPGLAAVLAGPAEVGRYRFEYECRIAA